jgi:PEP-CTERM motif
MSCDPLGVPVQRVRLVAIASSFVAMLAVTAIPARGDLIMQVLDSSATAGGTGSFDVILKETNGGTDAVSSDSVELSVSSGEGISFTAVDTNTDAGSEPYIYGSLQSPPFSTSSFPNTQFTASDADESVPFQTVLNDGDVYGLAHVSYSVAPGTSSEVVPVSLVSNGTALQDILDEGIDFTSTDGTITVTGASSAHAILSLTSSAPADYGNSITNGASGADSGAFTGPGAASNKLTVTGGSGSYIIAQVTGIGTGGNGDATNYLEANGFNPSTDPQIFAMDVEVDGAQASAGQLSTLISEINAFDGGLASGLSVGSTLANDPFAANYNLFLTADPGIAADDFLGFDVSEANDPALVDYSLSAVAVVPEPLSIALLSLGGIGLLSRRSRRRR